MHMLILNFLHQMQCNPPPADTTAKLLLRKQEQEMFLHSGMAKGHFPVQLSGLCLKALCSPIKELQLCIPSSFLIRKHLGCFWYLVSNTLKFETRVSQHCYYLNLCNKVQGNLH